MAFRGQIYDHFRVQSDPFPGGILKQDGLDPLICYHVLVIQACQFRFLAQRLARYGFSRGLYFCMESDEVWREVTGRAPRDLGGLSAHLLDVARNRGGTGHARGL